MASTDKTIRIILKLQDEMSKQLDKSANSLKKMGDNLTSVGTKMTMGITAPLLALGAAAVHSFMEFEDAMKEVEVRSGATADEMEKLRKLAMQMGRDTVFSATEAMQAMQELQASGSSVVEIYEQLPHVLDLAAAGAIDLKFAADGLTNVMKAFNLEAKDSEEVVNLLTAAAGASSASVNDLMQTFANIGPVAAAFGMTVEDFAATAAVLSDVGIKGAEAGTMIKSMLLNMSRDVDAVTGTWERLGVSMYDVEGNMRNVDDIFKDLNKAMEGMSMEEQNKIAQKLAGSYGIVAFNALRASNGISDMTTAMDGQATAAEVAEARNSTLSAKIANMMGSFEGLGIVLTTLSQGPLVWLIEKVTEAVNAFSDWAELNPEMAQFVIIILAIVAAIGPLLIIVGQLISAFAVVSAAIPAIATGFAALGGAIAFLLTPLGLFLAGFVLIVAAILGNWWGLRDGIVNSVGAIVNALSIVGDVFKMLGEASAKGWQQMLSVAATTLSQLGQLIWNALNNLTGGMLQLGANLISALIKGMASKAVDLIAYVFGLSKELTAAIKNALGIASPSKVMMDIGKNVVAGFHKGIETMGGVGVNVPQAQGGSRSAQPSLSYAGASAGGGGNVFNVYSAPGTTDEQAQDIAKKVSRIIADDAKRKGAR